MSRCARVSDAGHCPLDAALDVALQVARGLGAAHARGFVHRDLKPENIFLAADGRVKILDFGLATLHDSAPQASPPQEPSAAPMRSLVGGTAGYMAPEQVRGEVVDRRADIFALGTVLYEMLAGRQPFRGDSALATLDAVLSHEPQDLSDVNPAVPPALSRTVRRCLSKSPDDRFATVADLASALESVMRARPPATLACVRSLRRPSVMVPVLAVMLAVVAGGWRWRVDASRARWARTIAAPEAQRLLNHGDYVEAFLLARQALDVVPDDPNVKQLWLGRVHAGIRDHRPRRRRCGPCQRTEHVRPSGSPSDRRRSTAFACRAVKSVCGFRRQAFSRSRAPALSLGSATGWIL